MNCPNCTSQVIPGSTPALVFNNLITTLFAAQCSLVPPTDYPPDYTPYDGDNFDFVVIGAGSAGCAVAGRLAEISDWKILLIEAGDNPRAESDVPVLFATLFASENDWTYFNDPDDTSCLGMNGQRCIFPRGKAMGGSSSMNYMLYVRGNRADYDEWERMGNVGWGYQHVLKYFKKSEHLLVNSSEYSEVYHGRDGPLGVSRYGDDGQFGEYRKGVLAAARERGLKSGGDVNGESQMRFTEVLATIRNGRRENAAKVFLGKGKLKNLFVSKNSYVEQLMVEGDEVKGVRFVKEGKVITVHGSREVIVSAGSINSPQILMNSGLGPRAHLEQVGVPVKKDIPGVGENLKDHPGYLLAFKLRPTGRCLEGDELAAAYSQFLMNNGSGFFSSVSISNLMGFVDTRNPKATIPDLQYLNIAFCKGQVEGVRTFLNIQNLIPRIVEEYAKNAEEHDVHFLTTTLLRPKSTGTVRIRGRNASEPPAIVANFNSEQEDIDAMIRGIKFAINLFQSGAMKDLQAEPIMIDLPECAGLSYDAKWTCYIKVLTLSIYHPVGTCKMGPTTDYMAVVDPRLRVRGMKNLRVIDSSIFPVIPRGNCNAPSIMVGEKGADIIKEDWTQGSSQPPSKPYPPSQQSPQPEAEQQESLMERFTNMVNSLKPPM